MALSREHQVLEHLLGHDGWLLLRARMQDVVRLYYEQILIPSSKRKDSVPDDFIRGAIAALREMTEWPESEVKAAYGEIELEATRVREMREEEPLFGDRRPAFEEGDDHGRSENGSGASE
jgi:hypothetical protein